MELKDEDSSGWQTRIPSSSTSLTIQELKDLLARKHLFTDHESAVSHKSSTNDDDKTNERSIMSSLNSEERLEEFEKETSSQDEHNVTTVISGPLNVPEESSNDIFTKKNDEATKDALIRKYVKHFADYKYAQLKNLVLQDKLYKLSVRKGKIVEHNGTRKGKKRENTRLIQNQINYAPNSVDLYSPVEGGTIAPFQNSHLAKKFEKIVHEYRRLLKTKEGIASKEEKRLKDLQRQSRHWTMRSRQILEQLTSRIIKYSSEAVATQYGKHIDLANTRSYIQDVTGLCLKLQQTTHEFYKSWHELNLSLQELEHAETPGNELNLIEYEHLCGENKMLLLKTERQLEEIAVMKNKVSRSIHLNAHLNEKDLHLAGDLSRFAVTRKTVDKNVHELSRRLIVMESDIVRHLGDSKKISSSFMIANKPSLIQDYKETEKRVAELVETKKKISQSIGSVTINIRSLECILKSATSAAASVEQSKHSIRNDSHFQKPDFQHVLLEGTSRTSLSHLHYLLQTRNSDPSNYLMQEIPMKLSPTLPLPSLQTYRVT